MDTQTALSGSASLACTSAPTFRRPFPPADASSRCDVLFHRLFHQQLGALGLAVLADGSSVLADGSRLKRNTSIAPSSGVVSGFEFGVAVSNVQDGAEPPTHSPTATPGYFGSFAHEHNVLVSSIVRDWNVAGGAYPKVVSRCGGPGRRRLNARSPRTCADPWTMFGRILVN